MILKLLQEEVIHVWLIVVIFLELYSIVGLGPKDLSQCIHFDILGLVESKMSIIIIDTIPKIFILNACLLLM